MTSSRRPYERLLRWYPRDWRETHGEVFLALLQDDDDAAGRTRPSRADAWSARVRGTAEHLTPTAGWVLATAGAAASLVSLVLVFAQLGGDGGGEPPSTGWEVLTTPTALAQLLATAAAPALISLAAVALLRSVHLLGDHSAVLAGASAVAAWCLAALTSASWGVGFERADAGLAQTAFGDATWPLFLAATAVGTVTAAAVWDGVLSVVPTLRDARRRRGPRVLARRALAVVLAAPTALFLGLGAVAPGSAFVAGAALAAACLVRRRDPAPRSVQPAPPQPPLPRRRRPPLVADGRRAAAAGQLAEAALVVGSAATAHALGGFVWQDALLDAGLPLAGMRPMNLGLAVGSGATALVVVAVALLLARQRSRAARWVTAGVVVAVLLRGVDALRGPESGAELLFAGGALLGLVGAVVLARVLPGRPALRWTTAGALGVGVGVGAGTGALAVGPLLAPLGAAVVLGALFVSAARARRSVQSADTGPPRSRRSASA